MTPEDLTAVAKQIALLVYGDGYQHHLQVKCDKIGWGSRGEPFLDTKQKCTCQRWIAPIVDVLEAAGVTTQAEVAALRVAFEHKVEEIDRLNRLLRTLSSDGDFDVLDLTGKPPLPPDDPQRGGGL